MPPDGNAHYSYVIYADPSIAEKFDRTHFGGPIGQLIAEMQERVLVSFAGDLRGISVLDVGTGTGRAAFVLAGNGAHVTAVDASLEMLKIAEARSAQAPGISIRFMQGDAHDLSFPNRSYDVVVSLRMLMHTLDWRQCLSELCRVAQRRVVFDYPPLISAAALQVGARHMARFVGRNVEAYRVISTRAIRTVLNSEGFRIVDMNRQFVLPIALHKAVGSRRFTEKIEKLLASVGLLQLMGAPVTIVAEREER